MKILNVYILKQLVVGFLLVLCSMTALVWLTQSLKMINMIVTRGVSVRIFLEMTFLVLPNFLEILSPIALFAVVLFVFSRMQSDKELMVMQAVGMSPRQIMTPALMFACFLMVCGYFLTMVVVPAANSNLRELKWRARNDLSHLLLQEGQFNSLKNGLVLYVKERLSDGSVKGVIAYDSKDPEKTAILVAKQGLVVQEPDGIQLVFQDGTRQELNPETNQFSILKFEKYTMRFNDKANSNTRTADASEFSLMHLLKATPADAPTPAMYRKYKVEAVKRLAQPFYNIVFVLLALFGVLSRHYNRRGQVGRINFVVGAALVVQSLSLAFDNLATKNLWFTPLIVLNVVIPMVILYGVMIRGKQLPKQKTHRAIKTTAVILAACLFALPATAQVKLDSDIHVDQDKPVDFEADIISYDKNKNFLTATGNVVIVQNGLTLKTEKIVFDRTKNEITAPEKVTFTLPDGTVTHSENATLSGDMKQAAAHAMVTYMYDGTRITSKRIKRTDDGNTVYLKRITYTPCSTCNGQTPLWELSARNMKEDNLNNEMRFIHSFLNVKDVPVFYFPYLKVPDFSVKRKTGLLAPSFSGNGEIKSGLTLPFFVDVADNQNLIVTPTFSPDHDPLGIVEYEGLFTRGKLQFDTSLTRDDDNAKQGHIRAYTQYDITDNWRFTGQLFRASSDTYFRRYRLPNIDDNQSYLSSYASLERFGTRNYFSFNGYAYQSLQSRVSSKSIPIIIPVADYQYFTDTLGDSSAYLFSQINAAAYHTRERFKSDRLTVVQGVRLPYISSFGAAFEVEGSVRMDGYNVDTGKRLIANYGQDETYTTGRFYPTFAAKMRYPMARVTKNTTQVLEPIVMLVSSPDSANNDKIPDVDSIDQDFDSSNLFSTNRFSGFDRVETGTRTNYGVQWSLYGSQNASISALIGQSYWFTSPEEELWPLLGVGENRFSDYVGRLSVNYKWLSMAYRTRLDQNSLAVKKNEFMISGGGAPLRLGIDYVYLNEMRNGTNYYPTREEVLLFGSSKLTRHWSLNGLYRYRLTEKDKGPIEYTGQVQWENECTAVIFEISKSFTRDRNYEGDTSFMVKFILKTLGGM